MGRRGEPRWILGRPGQRWLWWCPRGVGRRQRPTGACSGLGVAHAPEVGPGSGPGSGQLTLRRLNPAWRSAHRARAIVALLLAGGFGLVGCASTAWRPPVVLYVALSAMEQESITQEISHQFHRRVYQMVAGFRRVHPNVEVQIVVYPEQELQQQIRLRNRSGLGPDLILTSADHANALLARNLVDPMPLTAREQQAIDPLLLAQLRDGRGRLAGLPLLIQPQLACFDRRRQPQPIGNVAELSQRSLAGLRVGLALALPDLIWSAGSFGAVTGLQAAASGRPLDARQALGLRTWLDWLQSSSGRLGISFERDNDALREGLRRGTLDWISCRSSDLPTLQGVLGPHLGVAPLPGGAERPALQVRPLRVIALGRNSSPLQRQLAIALSTYSVRPLVQRGFVTKASVGLPVTRYPLSLGRSETLQAMRQALQQPGGDRVEELALLALLHAEDSRLRLLQDRLTGLIFGAIDAAQAQQELIRILGPSRQPDPPSRRATP